MSNREKPDRPGWPLEGTIPPGEAWWRIFCDLATDEQVGRALDVVKRMAVEKKDAPK